MRSGWRWAAVAMLAGSRAFAGAAGALIENFDRAPLGRPAGALHLAPSQAATDFCVTIDAAGERGTRCLLLNSVPARAGWTRWVLKRPRNLTSWTGLRFAAMADAPVQLRVTLEGAGQLYWSGTLAGGWRVFDLPFLELPGAGGFQAEKFSAVSFTAVHDGAKPVDVRIDSIEAYHGPAATRTSLGFSFMTAPDGWKDDSSSTYGMVWAGAPAGVRLWSFFTDPVAYAPPSRLGLTWGTLPHRLAGRTGVSVVLAITPPQPRCLIRLGLSEAGGERFIALRDAPSQFGELYVPFSEFTPDAGNNLTLGAEVQNGRLDLDAVNAWVLDVIPVTEQPARGKLAIREAWAVTRR